MNIGFIAHNNKKNLIENFCLAYKYIFSKHNLYATGITGRRIEEVTNLKVYKFLPGSVGGDTSNLWIWLNATAWTWWSSSTTRLWRARIRLIFLQSQDAAISIIFRLPRTSLPRNHLLWGLPGAILTGGWISVRMNSDNQAGRSTYENLVPQDLQRF